jgi:hypothetical protein
MSTIAYHRQAPPLVVRWDRVLLLLVVLLAVTWGVLAGTARPSGASAPPPPARTVVVQPGDTLWALAQDHAPAGVATLEYVALVEQLNGVRAGALRPGTPLHLP